MRSAVNWFEIPVADFERAVTFYTGVMGEELQRIDMETRKLAMFPASEENDSVTGSLLHTSNFEPSKNGTIVYLNPKDGLDGALERVQTHGGMVDTPKIRIGRGYLATFIDTEGNTVGLLEWDKE